MAIPFHKAVKDLTAHLKKEKYPKEKKASYWDVLKKNLTQEGVWSNELLDSTKQTISAWLEKLKKADLENLWSDSESSSESISGNDVSVEQLADEFLDLILEQVEDATPREEFFINEAKNNNEKFLDDVDDDLDLDKDIFDDDDFDDFDDDVFEDDDRY
ncbi:MAG: hypothetical protein U5K00_09940 [Melioribacteraceae bacterium]|nr:hypothetical protein [Melioribacteraceae bacterium]